MITLLQTKLPASQHAFFTGSIKMVNYNDIDMALAQQHKPHSRNKILIHNSFNETPQRFINCLQADSYIRPHMHSKPSQWELLCWLSGEIIVLIFDNTGIVTNKFIMNEYNVRIVEIPPLCYHTVVAIKPSSYLEIFNHTYDISNPSLNKAKAKWSPEENNNLASYYHKQLITAELGDKIII